MLLETEVKPEIQIEKNNQVSVIILLYKNPNFKGFSKPFDIEIYGKKMWKYVELAVSDYNVKTTLCTPETDVLALIKPMLTNSHFTLVLYSDTPLLQKNVVSEIVRTAEVKDINVMRLDRGFIFNTEYIKTIDSIQATLMEHFGEDDFTTASDFSSLENVAKTLKNRILDFHQKNGIFIVDASTTFIDADVIIESGTIIEPNNVIKGNSFVGKNVILRNGNVVVDSIIGASSILNGAYVENSKIEDGSVLNAFERVIGK